MKMLLSVFRIPVILISGLSMEILFSADIIPLREFLLSI
jgi:hypothetical protein